MSNRNLNVPTHDDPTFLIPIACIILFLLFLWAFYRTGEPEHHAQDDANAGRVWGVPVPPAINALAVQEQEPAQQEDLRPAEFPQTRPGDRGETRTQQHLETLDELREVRRKRAAVISTIMADAESTAARAWASWDRYEQAQQEDAA